MVDRRDIARMIEMVDIIDVVNNIYINDREDLASR